MPPARSAPRRGLKPIHLAGLAILAAAWLLRQLDPAPVQALRLAVFDQYQRLAGRPRVETAVPVVLVDVDEASLQEVGQWPWPRSVLARLVEALADGGVAVVGFDMVFPEYDRLSPARLADRLPGLDAGAAAALRALPATEQAFAAAMARLPVALGQGAVAEVGAVAEPLPRRATFAELGGEARGRVIAFGGLVRNVPELEAAASGLGVITLAPEIDGVVRRVNLLAEVDGELYPALSLEMLRLAARQPTILVRSDQRTHSQSVRVQGLPPIPTDSRFRTWIRFRDGLGDLYVSAADVLAGRIGAVRLAGALAVVGSSALGLHDLKRTPLAANTPGLEIHGQVLEGVLAGTFLHRPPWLEMVEGALVAVVGLFMIALVPRLGATTTLAFAALVVAALGAGSWYAFARHQMLADPLYPALTGLLLYLALGYMNWRQVEAQKQGIRDAFGRFLAPAMVERLAADPSQLRLGGEMKELTLLFGDIRGFTAIAEQLDPEALTGVVNRFFTPMTQAVLDSGGTVDKYIGDCIMAFWNAPLDVADHARRAAGAALRMQADCAALNRALEAESAAAGRAFRPLRLGIGINTDTVCVGNMGSAQRFDYSVLGDGVNLASRLEGQTKTYGLDIVVGERSRAQAPDHAYIELDLIRVAGRARPARIHALLGGPELAGDAAFTAFARQHAAALAAYRARHWDDCARIIDGCREQGRAWPVTQYYDLLAGRVAEFRRRGPGEDWDGVWDAAAK